jgi:flavin reductase (DIM6/NTAB) family NADH-FMN oxidoreductase RutF
MSSISSGIAAWKQFFGRSSTTKPIARIDPGTFRDVMREVAAPVTILAAGRPGYRNGLTATAVCSVSDSPPTVLACVRRNAKAHDVIVNSGCFSINFLSAEQEDVAVQFSGARGVCGEERFSVGDWSTGMTGAPILGDCVCTIECQLVGTQLVATHTIILGELVDGQKRESEQALLYRSGRYHSLPLLSAGRKSYEARNGSENEMAVSLD